MAPTDDGSTPADLKKTNAESAAAASTTSKASYTKTIKMPLVKGKEYKFYFKYKHEDPDTKEVKLSDSSPVWKETFAIPNLTKAVKNLTLTAGSQSYGVKFDLDPLSVQEDVVIFESLTSDFASQTIVYTGTSTSVSILTTGPNAFADRWVKVRSRDRWDDLNISEATQGPVKPFSADVDTTYTVANPTGPSATASIDPKDLSGFSLVSTITWTQSSDVKTAGYAIRWSTTNPDTGTPLWEYASVSGRSTTSFTATGLIPNTTYYYQIASTTPYDVVEWTGAASGTFIASDADGTAAGALARLKSFIAIGGATQDLFKIGTGIAQGINLSTDPIASPTLTDGTYHGIILNKSTTNVGNNFWLTTGQFRVGNPTEFMYWNGTNLYLTGNVNATGGKFTGNVQLAIPAGGTTSGTLYAGASPTTGARVRLSSEGIFAYDSTSTSNTTGKTFSLEQATGRLDAVLGTVGGWTLAATGFSSGGAKIENTGNISLGNNPQANLQSIVRLSADDPTYRLWVGSQTAASAKFRVSKDGVLYAEGAVIGLGAGSTIDGYATTSALNSYTLSSVTTGINSRLTSVEGNYVNVSTLNTGLASKSTTFVTDTNDAPTPNKLGDLWINGGDGNEIYTAVSLTNNPVSSRWSKKTNTNYATTTALNSKLSAGDYVVANSTGNITEINTNGVTVHSGVITNNGGTTVANSGVSFNSEGIRGWYKGVPTFSVLKDGTASFAGQLSAASGTFNGVLVAGADNDTTGYINTGASRTVGTYGSVTYVKIRALGLESTSNSGFVSSVYPWLDNSASLGTNSYSWNSIYIGSNAYFANATTYRINSSADAYLNGYGVSGGYGITSDWSPRTDNTYSLGLSTRRWVDVWAVDTSVNSSDVRLKKDIVTSALGLDFIKLLRPVSYKWKQTGVQEVLEDKEVKHLDKQGNVELVEIEKIPKITGVDEDGRDIVETTSREGLRDHYGFIAQEVKEALDSTGIGDSFAGWVLDDHNNPSSRQNLRYSEFISPLVKAVQELSDMVESLQQEINTLKGA